MLIVFVHSSELINLISFPVQFPVLDLLYFFLFIISLYFHRISLPLRTSFILAVSECGTISLYIL